MPTRLLNAYVPTTTQHTVYHQPLWQYHSLPHALFHSFSSTYTTIIAGNQIIIYPSSSVASTHSFTSIPSVSKHSLHDETNMRSGILRALAYGCKYELGKGATGSLTPTLFTCSPCQRFGVRLRSTALHLGGIRETLCILPCTKFQELASRWYNGRVFTLYRR